MATRTPFEVISHTRRVCSLYKKVLKTVQDYYPDRAEYRYQACLMRDEFEKKRHIKNFTLANKLVTEAEAEHDLKRHYQPFVFPESPGGSAYGRYVYPPDGTLDYWDPIEKSCFPEYFKLREQRKKEYIELWEKKYGKVDIAQYHGH